MAKKYAKFSDKGRCRFCRAKVEEIDYKNVDSLKRLCTTQGKLFSRKRSGNCAKHQRQAKVAIKRARYMALLPYIG
ncbi:MAG: 30S ribosomal protein S18 [Planctomycetota bacterium]|jgi:small subunit ribosomal protein S18